MQARYQHYLTEMGIEQWTLRHPERLCHYQAQYYQVDDSCRLLFVCARLPQSNELAFLAKITQSFGIEVEDIQHVSPEDFHLIQPLEVDWVWFCGCQPIAGLSNRTLISPFLCDIDGNIDNRRALWSQICANQKS